MRIDFVLVFFFFKLSVGENLPSYQYLNIYIYISQL